MKLRVLSLNVWGLHYLAERIRDRLEGIAKELHAYDIVGLQEVWSKEDFKFLKEKLKKDFPHSHYFHSGIVGSGLCIFSRYQIVEAFSHSFRVTGGVRDFTDGEVFVGKGVLCCRIKTPEGCIAFINTHANPKCRESQMFECYQFVQRTRGNDPVILCGDFNTKPTHVPYDLFTKCLGLKDAFADLPLNTCDLTTNIYTVKHMTPKRIDYIFYGDENCPSHMLVLQDKALALTGHIPGKNYPYSDHEGVEATFSLEQRKVHHCPAPVVMTEECVTIFRHLASIIQQKKGRYNYSSKQVVSSWVVLTVLVLLVAVVMNHPTLFNFLADYHLGWMGGAITGLAGAIAMVIAFVLFSAVQLKSAMETNIAEINTLISSRRNEGTEQESP